MSISIYMYRPTGTLAPGPWQQVDEHRGQLQAIPTSPASKIHVLRSESPGNPTGRNLVGVYMGPQQHDLYRAWEVYPRVVFGSISISVDLGGRGLRGPGSGPLNHGKPTMFGQSKLLKNGAWK